MYLTRKPIWSQWPAIITLRFDLGFSDTMRLPWMSGSIAWAMPLSRS
jgi:hypothetical protein